MDPMLLRVFQKQVLLQCESLLYAADDLNQTLRVRVQERNLVTARRVFYDIQNMLNSAANISKALWGQGGKLAVQRRPLRDSIGIADTSPLRDVVMRNNFEHFDERLESWWTQSTHHNYVDLTLGPPEQIAGVDEIDTFRFFVPRSAEIVFWGQRFNLQTLVDEVNRILPALRAEAAKPHWIP